MSERRLRPLTATFQPTLYSDEWACRLGEDLAEKFVAIHDNLDDDEQIRELYARADDALVALFAEIWKRNVHADLERRKEEEEADPSAEPEIRRERDAGADL